MKKAIICAIGQLSNHSTVDLKNSDYNVVTIGKCDSGNDFFASKGIEFIGGFDN